MIKRIIFDLDNTLIMWKDKYLEALQETILEYHLNIDYVYLSGLIDEYDNLYKKYDKNLLVTYLNSITKENITLEFLETFLDKFGNMSDIASHEVINTLEYLSKRYELVVLTNWFTKPQTERLKNAHILKYFKEVIGGEINMKPKKEAFLKACHDYKPNECIMIGDDYNKDIRGAIDAHLNVIYYNFKNKANELKVTEIKKLSELKEIL